MSSGIIVPDVAALTRLYTGASLGAAGGAAAGTAAAYGGDASVQARIDLLTKNLQAGTIKSSQLSTGDQALLKSSQAGIGGTATLNPLSTIPKPSGNPLGIFGKAVDIVGQNLSGAVGDIGDSVLSLPALGRGLLNWSVSGLQSGIGAQSGHGAPSDTPLGGPSISPQQIASTMAIGTLHDFTQARAGTLYRPLEDIATIPSGGAGIAGKVAESLGRAAEAARAVDEGMKTASEVGSMRAAIGRSAAVQRAQPFVKWATQTVRPEIPPSPDAIAQRAEAELQYGSSPRYYSSAPFRRYFVQHPVDWLLTKEPKASLLGRAQERLIRSPIRTYTARHYIPTMKARIQAGQSEEIAKAINPILNAYQNLRRPGFEESRNAIEKGYSALRGSSLDDYETELKHQAVTARAVIASDIPLNNPDLALERLDQYVKELRNPEPMPDEIKTTYGLKENVGIRDQNIKMFEDPNFRRYFANPTPEQLHMLEVWRNAAFETVKKLGYIGEEFDPMTAIEHHLAGIAHITKKSVDQLIGEMPTAFRQAGTFAKGLRNVDESLKAALKGAKEGEPTDLGEIYPFVPELAASIPGGDLATKQNIIWSAIDSFIKDARHDDSMAVHLGQDETYLPGRTLAAKVGQGLQMHGVMTEHEAERFMAGDPIDHEGGNIMPIYWPQMDSDNMRLAHTRGPLRRAVRVLRGLENNKVYTDAAQGWFSRRAPSADKMFYAAQIGLNKEPGFMKEATHQAFMQGTMRLDSRVMIRHIIQRERHVISTDLTPRALDPVSLKRADGSVLYTTGGREQLQTLLGSKEAARHWMPLPEKLIRLTMQEEDHVALNALQAIHDAGGQLSEEEFQQMMQNEDLSARITAREAVSQAESGVRWVPTQTYNQILRLSQPTRRIIPHWDQLLGRWRHATLAMMPSWFFRTTAGHGMLMWLGGGTTMPYLGNIPLVGNSLTSRFADLAHASVDPSYEMENRYGLMEPGRIAYPAGIQQGHQEASFHDAAQQQFLQSIGLSGRIQSGVHNVMNFQRRETFIKNLEKVARQNYANLQNSIEETGRIFRKFETPEEVDNMIRLHPEWGDHALNELDRMSYSFGAMTPWERTFSKNVMPFWGWYKFASKFVWNLPINFPGRANALMKLGQMSQEMTQQEYGNIPDWMKQDYIYSLASNGLAHYMNVAGYNPLGDTMNFFNDGGVFSTANLIKLGQLNPLLQAGMEAYGINTMTGGQESIDPTSGIIAINGAYYNINPKMPQQYSTLGAAGGALGRFVGSIARAFPQVRLGEQLWTGGYNTYPESIPFIGEKLVPTLTPKPANLGMMGLGFLGAQPKQYNLGKYQLNIRKDVERARSTYIKDILKQRAQLPKSARPPLPRVPTG